MGSPMDGLCFLLAVKIISKTYKEAEWEEKWVKNFHVNSFWHLFMKKNGTDLFLSRN